MARGAFDSSTKIQTFGNQAFLTVGDRLEALSLVTGRVVDRHVVPGAIEDIDMVGRRLWVSVRDHQRLHLAQFTTTLRRVTQIRLGAAAPVGEPQGQMAPAPDGHGVLISDGTRLLIVSTATGRVVPVHFTTPPGEIDDVAWLSTSPERITVGHRAERGGRLFVYRLAGDTASPTATTNLGFSQVEQGGIQGFAGSPARVYLVSGLGHAVPVQTYQVRNRTMTAVSTDGDLMQNAEVDFSDHQLWIAGVDRLACADPRTGRETASTRLVEIGKHSSVSTLTTSRHRVVALVTHGARGASALVSVKPPATCRR